MLRQDATQKLVHYDFDLTKGEYKANYQFQCTGFVTEVEPGHLCSNTNMNLEDSWVKTAHFVYIASTLQKIGKYSVFQLPVGFQFIPMMTVKFPLALDR